MNSTPDVSPDAREWLSVSTAAARLGISARAVQKRCAAGKMKARRITTPQGVRWELDGRELGREPTNEQGANYANQTHEPGSLDAQNGTNRDANPRTGGHEPTNPANGQEAELRELLARERDLNGFLRGLIEQRDRDAAELRAALRDALKSTARQLTTGGASDADEQRAHPMPSPTPNSQQHEPDDEMSAEEILNLCRRIAR